MQNYLNLLLLHKHRKFHFGKRPSANQQGCQIQMEQKCQIAY